MQNGITIFGLIFIPVTLIINIFYRNYLIPFLVFSSIFSAASIYNFTNFSIPPYYFLSSIIGLQFLIRISISRKKNFHKELKHFSIILFIFCLWSISSAFFLPFIFEGIKVFNPREGLDSQVFYQSRLYWTTSNAAQAIYLILNIINVYAIVNYISNNNNKVIILKTFLFTSIIAVIMVIYHSLSKFLGLVYPNDILYSNPFYYQGFEQTIGILYRANGTFVEPSIAGAFIAGLTSALFASRLDIINIQLQKLFFIISFIALITTTATTAYYTFFIMLLIFLLFKLISIKRLTFNKLVLSNLLLLFILFIGVYYLLIYFDLLFYILELTVNKSETGSFHTRIFSDLFAIGIFYQTYGIGVGLGSNRPSSFFTSLLSNLGFLGFCFFIFLIYIIVKYSIIYKNSTNTFMFYVFIGTLLAHIISIPDLTSPILWIEFALTIAFINHTILNEK